MILDKGGMRKEEKRGKDHDGQPEEGVISGIRKGGFWSTRAPACHTSESQPKG
jgi:hypothetical protein